MFSSARCFLLCLFFTFSTVAWAKPLPPKLRLPKEDFKKKLKRCYLYSDILMRLQVDILKFDCGTNDMELNPRGGSWSSFCMEQPLEAVKYRIKVLNSKYKACQIKACQTYVKTTHMQQRMQKLFYCKFSGTRWFASKSQLHSWCLKAHASDVAINRKEQKKMLEGCVKQKKTFCASYARTAAYVVPILSSCGFTNPISKLGNGYSQIYNACLTKDSIGLSLWLVNAEKDKKICQKKKKAQCDQFVPFAITAESINRNLLCGYRGEEWQTSNYSNPNSCQIKSYALIQKVQKSMQEKIAQCKAKRGNKR